MSLKLWDLMWYHNGKISRMEAHKIVNENPTPWDILKEQLDGIRKDFERLKKSIERYVHDDFDFITSTVDDKTILSKIDMMLMEPKITAEMKPKLVDMQNYLLNYTGTIDDICKLWKKRVEKLLKENQRNPEDAENIAIIEG
jgi:hypothetical protein